MRKSTLIFLLIALFSSVAGANELDSLLVLLKTAKDTQRIHLLNLICDEMRFTNLDSALKYGHQGLELAEKEEHSVLMLEAYNHLGNAYKDKGNYELSLIYLHKAETLALRTKNTLWLAKTTNNLGNVYGEQGNDQKSLEYYIKGYAAAEEVDDADAMVVTSANIGTIYLTRQQYPIALKYFKGALQSIPKLKRPGNKLRVTFTMWINMGVAYGEMQQYDSARHYFEMALDLAKINDLPVKVGLAKEQIGSILMKKGELDSAIAIFEETLVLYRQLDLKAKVQDMLVYLGQSYVKTNRYTDAEKVYSEALKLSGEIGMNSYTYEIYEGLSHVAENTGDYKRALGYYRLALRFKDSVRMEENDRTIMELQTRFDTEKKEKEIELLHEKDRNSQIIIWSSAAVLLLVLLSAIFFFNAYRTKRKANLLLERQKTEIVRQKHIIEEKNKDITDSISYAERIQHALLTSEHYIRKHFGEHFIFFQPRDIVSGDFYWGYEKDGSFFFTAADSTGHGVPGAFMSMIGVSLLNEIVIERKISNPALILDILREEIIHRLNPDGKAARKDGMDMVLIRYDKTARELDYAAANNSFYIIRKGKIMGQPADKMPVGAHDGALEGFTRHRLPVEKGDMVYLFTDGFADQFGGTKGKKFKYKQLETTLLQISEHSCEAQGQLLEQIFRDWKGDLEQVDDVLVAGFRIS